MGNAKSMSKGNEYISLKCCFGAKKNGLAVDCKEFGITADLRFEAYDEKVTIGRFTFVNNSKDYIYFDDLYIDILCDEVISQDMLKFKDVEEFYLLLPGVKNELSYTVITAFRETQFELAEAYENEGFYRLYLYAKGRKADDLYRDVIWRNESRAFTIEQGEKLEFEVLIKECDNDKQISEFLLLYDRLPHSMNMGINGMYMPGHHYDDIFIPVDVFREFANSKLLARLKNGRLASLVAASGSIESISENETFGDVYVSLKDSTDIDTKNLPWFGGEDACFFCRKDGIKVCISFMLNGKKLSYYIKIENENNHAVEIDELRVPITLNSKLDWGINPADRMIRHSQVAGDNSFFLGTPCDGNGPYLLCTPHDGTALELFDMIGGGEAERGIYNVYIHGEKAAKIARGKNGGRWRLPTTTKIINPKEALSYGFDFEWVNGYEESRDALVKSGKLDIKVLPGLTVPVNQAAKIRIRSKYNDLYIIAEYPDETKITLLSQNNGVFLYEVEFNKIGENLLSVKYGDCKVGYIEMYAALPIENLLNARANYLKESQVANESLWFDGLIRERNSLTGAYIEPGSYDGLSLGQHHKASADDAALGKPAFLASKNVAIPNQEEVSALDRYIEKFVWGGLQRTDKEEYPYGIYGCPDWKNLRSLKNYSPTELLHIWRMYDYSHIGLLYYKMYEIGVTYPDIDVKLEPVEYLKRAQGTFMAQYQYAIEIEHSYPWNRGNWSPYDTGFYNELVITDVIEALRREGLLLKAMRLEYQWKQKVNTFLLSKYNIFQSECPFDTTGFETTQAVVDWGRTHATELYNSDYRSITGYTRIDVERFAKYQMNCNVACRGYIENAYYITGSDIRGESSKYTLGYMSQMGGWAVLQEALYSEDSPFEMIRLGYTSLLSSFALINAGKAEDDYGYWFPGLDKQGASSGGFEAVPAGVTWMGQEHHKGVWIYGAETDLGYCAYLRGAAVIYVIDPEFGEVCYGGLLNKEHEKVEIIPIDAVSSRLHIVLKDDIRLHVILKHARIQRIILQGDKIRIVLEEVKSEQARIHISSHKPCDSFVIYDKCGNDVTTELKKEEYVDIKWRHG